MLTDGEAGEDCIWEQVLLSDELPSDEMEFDVDVQFPEDWSDVDHA